MPGTFISKLLNIRPAEWPRLLMLYITFFVFIVGYIWSITILEAAFLKQIGLEFLPWFAVAKGVVSIPAIAVYSAFADRVSNRKLLVAILSIGMGGMAFGLGLLGLGWVQVAYPLLYFLAFIPLDDILGAQWLIYVNDFYDTRAAKRIMPVLGTSLSVASTVAGLTMPFVSSWLSPIAIVEVWLGTTATMALMIQAMAYLFKDKDPVRPLSETGTMPAPTKTSRHRTRQYVDSMREGARFVLQSSFLRWLTVSTLLVTILLTLLQYQASQILVSELASTERIAGFLGTLTGVSNLIMLPIQLFLLSRIIGRIGVGNANLIYPFSMLPVSGALVAVSTLPSAALAYVGRTSFFFSVGTLIDSLLYNAAPPSLKGRSRAFIGGLITPIGSLVGGGLLLLAQGVALAWIVPGLIAMLAVAYAASALAVRSRYGQALVEMLARDDFSYLLSRGAGKLTAADPAMLNDLKRRLEASTSNDLTIFLAQLIGEIGGDQVTPILAPIARASPDPHLRAAIVDVLAVAEVRGTMVLRLYSELLADPDNSVRLAAINGLEQFFGSDSAQYLAYVHRMLADPEAAVRARVLPAHLRAKVVLYRDAGLQALDAMLNSPEIPQRVLGVRALGLTGDRNVVPQLLPYVHDRSDEVRLEAAIAIETLALNGLPKQELQPVIEHMRGLAHDPVERVRQAALLVLGHIGDQATYPVLVEALTEPSTQVREIAVDMLVRAGDQAVPLVSAELAVADPHRRKMAAVVLSRVNRHQFGGMITSYVYDNLVAIYQNYGALEAMMPCAIHSSAVVLYSTLNEQNDRLLDDIFYLLKTTYVPEMVQVINDSLGSSDPFVRANATEALEALTNPQIASLVSVLYDPEMTTAQKLQISVETWDTALPGGAETIRKMAADPYDPWLRAMAIFLLGEIGASLVRQEQLSLPTYDTGPPRLASKTGEAPDLTTRLANVRARLPQPFNRPGTSPGVDQPAIGTSPGGGEVASMASAPGEPLFQRAEIEQILQAAERDSAEEVQIALRAALRMMALARQPDAPEPEPTRQLSAVEKVIFLKGVPFFQGMTIDQLRVLATVCEERWVAADQQVFAQGDPGGALFVIVNGRIGIERERRTGSFARLATMGARGHFGEMSLFDDSPRSASAIALQDTLLLCLRGEPLIALARRHPDLSLELIKVFSQQLREMNDRVAGNTKTKPRALQQLFDQF